MGDRRFGDRGHYLAGDLNFSEQRELENGMTLTTAPDVILLDEPTAGMSREETAKAVDLIRSVTEGKTLMMVEHRLKELFRLADRVIVINFGEKIAEGIPDDVMAQQNVKEAYMGVKKKR